MKFKRGDILAPIDGTEFEVEFLGYQEMDGMCRDCKVSGPPSQMLTSRGWLSMTFESISYRYWYSRGRHVLTEIVRFPESQ